MPTTTPPNCFRQLEERGYKFHVFISWPHMIQAQGRKIVAQLADALQDRFRTEGGGEVFLDEDRLKPGYELEPELRRSLCRSGITLAILVPSYFLSRYCLTEWHITEQLQRGRLPEGSAATCFIPLLLKEGTPLPNELGSLLYDRSFIEMLSYGRDPKRHPKWNHAVDALAKHVAELLKLLCQRSPDWTADEVVAMGLGPREFSWPDEEPATSAAASASPPEKRELAPAVSSESKL